jgi:hypothetical protein
MSRKEEISGVELQEFSPPNMKAVKVCLSISVSLSLQTLIQDVLTLARLAAHSKFPLFLRQFYMSLKSESQLL